MKTELDGTHVDQLDLDTTEHPVYTQLDARPVGVAAYRKAIVAVAGAVVAIAAALGTDIDPEVTQSVIALATALLVYLVPNETGMAAPLIDTQDRERVGID